MRVFRGAAAGAWAALFLFGASLWASENISLDLGGGVKMEFVWVPLPGGEGKVSVQIGDFTGVHGLEPVKEVAVTGPFANAEKEFGYYLGKTEVTEAQWAAIMNGIGRSRKPAVDKSYAEVLGFIDAMNSMVGQSLPKTPDGKCGEVRLPTEAEWEYAGRGGAGPSYRASDPYQGDIERYEVFATPGASGRAREVAKLPPNQLGLCDMLGNVREFVQGRYSGDRGGGRLLKGGCFTQGTWPVGQKASNELGLHDMSGDVWEWCWDPYGSGRRIRGGGWDYPEIELADRGSRNDFYGPYFSNQNDRNSGIGFRPVRTVENATAKQNIPSAQPGSKGN